MHDLSEIVALREGGGGTCVGSAMDVGSCYELADPLRSLSVTIKSRLGQKALACGRVPCHINHSERGSRACLGKI